jgi:hypothetical protein
MNPAGCELSRRDCFRLHQVLGEPFRSGLGGRIGTRSRVNRVVPAFDFQQSLRFSCAGEGPARLPPWLTAIAVSFATFRKSTVPWDSPLVLQAFSDRAAPLVGLLDRGAWL